MTRSPGSTTKPELSRRPFALSPLPASLNRIQRATSAPRSPASATPLHAVHAAAATRRRSDTPAPYHPAHPGDQRGSLRRAEQIAFLDKLAARLVSTTAKGGTDGWCCLARGGRRHRRGVVVGEFAGRGCAEDRPGALPGQAVSARARADRGRTPGEPERSGSGVLPRAR